MNKKLLAYLSIFIICFFGTSSAQTYQLTGNPVVTTGWTMVAPTQVNGDFIQLTPDTNNQSGSIRLNEQINLKYCDKWRVEFDFRMDSNQTANGDGIAFWYLQNPPVASVLGSGLGVSQNAIGLVVGFDTYNNTTTAVMSKVHVGYGQIANTTDNNNVEFFNTPGSSFHSPDMNTTLPFQGTTYKHVEVTSEVDPANPANWIIKITIDGNIICNQSFAPAGAATAAMTIGYFGFSASTGGNRSRHSVKNVKVYVDKVAISQTTVTDTFCPNPSTGQGTANLTSYQNQFVTNPANYTFSYSVAGTPITTPGNYQFAANTTVSVLVKDNSGLLCDNPDGKIQLNLSPFTATPATLTACNNNNIGTAMYNLNLANVNEPPGSTKKYYKTMADLNAGTNEITNPTAYLSIAGTVYVKVTTPLGCTGSAPITLAFYPQIPLTDVTMQSCFIETNVTTALFNLTTAAVTQPSQTGIVKQYYTTLANAQNGTNEIQNPAAYVTTSTTVYVRVTNTNGCNNIAKINLVVLPPVKSSVLKDKIICIDGRTDLDAGPGFDGYEWNTGATTQSIGGVPVGVYWVKLKTGNCITTQTVKVNASLQPVISSIDINNNTITVNVNGGNPPYRYSLDGINWQDSNYFTNLARGEVKVYVKDFYNCEPIDVQITVPNLINAITPNGDNINDDIDYSALAYKKNLVFTVYDRYGNQLYQADKIRNYKWDGTAFGKKIVTGTYWYTITWNENDKNNTQTKYNGWVLVKNRE